MGLGLTTKAQKHKRSNGGLEMITVNSGNDRERGIVLRVLPYFSLCKILYIFKAAGSENVSPVV
jgi:hypothetical protein